MNKLQNLIDIDLAFYREKYDDLHGKNDLALSDHYFEFGYEEGRVSHPLAEREPLVLSLGNVSTLEIGPFVTPLLKHEKMKYVDIMPKKGLVERAEKIGLCIDQAIDIDFVSNNGRLDMIEEKFQIVTSSHNLEHQPDLISHLNEVSSLLEDDGRYVMIVPNATYCFDADLPKSKISEIFNAHRDQRTLHTLGSVIEGSALTTHNDSSVHWSNQERGRYKCLDPERISNAIKAFNSAEGSYIDVHAWQFEPYSLSDILDVLIRLGCIEFRAVSCRGPVYGTFEFTVELYK